MTRPHLATYHYSLDRDDRLLSVSNTWISFARQNDAPELTRDRVLGHPVWDFVADGATRAIYDLLFGWVRSHGVVLSIPFRCDSPDCQRFMHLQLSPLEDDSIAVASILDREERRPHMRILDRFAPRSDYAFPLCSFCRRIFAFGVWLEPEEAVQRLGWLESQPPPRIEEDVCDDCERMARAQVEPGSAAPA